MSSGELLSSEDGQLVISETQQLDRGLWALLVKHRDGWKCRKCGKVRGEVLRMIAHHKDWDHTNNILANGESLCGSCHRLVHCHEEPYDYDKLVAEEEAKQLEYEGC